MLAAMEGKKKEKDHEVVTVAAVGRREHETITNNLPLPRRKDYQNQVTQQTGVTVSQSTNKKPRTTINPTHYNPPPQAPPQKHQMQSNFQWACTPQPPTTTNHNSHSQNRPAFLPNLYAAQLMQWQQQQQQQTSANNPPTGCPLTQTFQPFVPSDPSPSVPNWFPQRSHGQHGSHIDSSFQLQGLCGGASVAPMHQGPFPPNYYVGYPYMNFSGPWDTMSLWALMQAQQSQINPYAYNTFPGAACNSFPPGQPSQRGFIRAPVTLSQKHQLMWQAQSFENVQLWAVIGTLQTELADCKSRLLHLENECLETLDPSVEEEEEAGEQGTNNGNSYLPSQPPKEKRPGKFLASSDDTSLSSPDDGDDESLPKPPQDRKASTSGTKAHQSPEIIKGIKFDKDGGRNIKLEIKESSSKVIPSTPQALGGCKSGSIFTAVELSGGHNRPASHSQLLHNIQRVHGNVVAPHLNPSSSKQKKSSLDLDHNKPATTTGFATTSCSLIRQQIDSSNGNLESPPIYKSFTEMMNVDMIATALYNKNNGTGSGCGEKQEAALCNRENEDDASEADEEEEEDEMVNEDAAQNAVC